MEKPVTNIFYFSLFTLIFFPTVITSCSKGGFLHLFVINYFYITIFNIFLSPGAQSGLFVGVRNNDIVHVCACKY